MKKLSFVVAALAAVGAAAPLAEYPGEVGEKTGWKCVGSDEGKVVYSPFEGYYESKGGRIESPRFKRDAAHNDDRGKQLVAQTLAAYFRVVANSRTSASQTAELQARIDEVWRRGGGEVAVEAGTYELGSVRLRSGITLRLKAGAKILASTNVEDYVGTLLRDKVELVARETLERSFGEDLTRRSQYALFHALQAHDIVVVGEPGSAIDGRNCFDALGAEGYRGPHAFSFVATTNVVFRGIAVENAGDYAYKFIDSRNVVLDGAKAIAGHDGVHFDLCSEVFILNGCFLTGDDSVAGSGCRGIVISNCTLSSACSAVRLGGRDALVTPAIKGRRVEVKSQKIGVWLHRRRRPALPRDGRNPRAAHGRSLHRRREVHSGLLSKMREPIGFVA